MADAHSRFILGISAIFPALKVSVHDMKADAA